MMRKIPKMFPWIHWFRCKKYLNWLMTQVIPELLTTWIYIYIYIYIKHVLGTLWIVFLRFYNFQLDYKRGSDSKRHKSCWDVHYQYKGEKITKQTLLIVLTKRFAYIHRSNNDVISPNCDGTVPCNPLISIDIAIATNRANKQKKKGERGQNFKTYYKKKEKKKSMA